MKIKEKAAVIDLWQDVLQEVVRTMPAYHRDDDSLLIGTDLTLFQEVLAIKVMCFHDFLGYNFLHRHLAAFLRGYSNMTLVAVCAFWDEVDRCMFRWKTTEGENRIQSYGALKEHLVRTWPHAGLLIGPLRVEIQANLAGRLDNSRTLRSLFLQDSRLTLTQVSGLEDAAIQKFLDLEEHLRTFEYPDFTPYNRIVQKWYSRVDPYERFAPKHGSGVVAESYDIRKHDYFYRTLPGKYESCASDLVTKHLKRIPLFYDNPDLLPCWHFVPHKQSRTAVAALVPKGIDSKRVVGYMPAGIMFLEQGYAKVLDPSKNFFLKGHVNLYDQSLSQTMASWGAFSGEYATIDLSSASDSISWQLVRGFFEGTPWADLFEEIRTTHTELPNGVLHRDERFLPSGSALCFPVECIVFSAIIEKVCLQYYSPGTKLDYRVYGDDLVVPVEISQLVIDELVALGMKPNPLKSFYGQEPFREACGGEFYGHLDVTPVRIPRKFVGLLKPNSHHLAVELSTLITLANRMKTYFPSVQRVILHSVRCVGQDRFPKFSENRKDTSAIYSSSPTNYRHRRREGIPHQEWVPLNAELRTCDKWQRTEIRAGVLSCRRKRHDDDYLRYIHWFFMSEWRSPGAQPGVTLDDGENTSFEIPFSELAADWKKSDVMSTSTVLYKGLPEIRLRSAWVAV